MRLKNQVSPKRYWQVRTPRTCALREWPPRSRLVCRPLTAVDRNRLSDDLSQTNWHIWKPIFLRVKPTAIGLNPPFFLLRAKKRPPVYTGVASSGQRPDSTRLTKAVRAPSYLIIIIIIIINIFKNTDDNRMTNAQFFCISEILARGRLPRSTSPSVPSPLNGPGGITHAKVL